MSTCGGALSSTANSSPPMRPQTACSPAAPRAAGAATATTNSSAPSTPSWALTSAMPSSSISAKPTDLVARALGQREIEKLERLGVIGQAGELVGVGGAAGGLLARRQFQPRALELAQGKAGKADQQQRDAADERHQPVHGGGRRMRLVPGEEAGNAPLRIGHRLHFARAGRRIDFELESLQPRALLDHAHQARVERARPAEQSRGIRRWRYARRRAAPPRRADRCAQPGHSRKQRRARLPAWPRRR